jgi:hypothetical protein
MRQLMGCSGAIALLAFVVGLAVSLFVVDAGWIDRLMVAAGVSMAAFIAAFVLSSDDAAQHAATVQAVRTRLLVAADSSEEQFLASRPYDDTQLLLETRKAIARFFDVPDTKIPRDVHLLDDLQVDRLDPSFWFHVVNSVVVAQHATPTPFTFNIAGLQSIDELARAIEKVLDG